MNRNLGKIAYIIIIIAAISLPFWGLIFYNEPESTENKSLSSSPHLFTEDGSANINYLEDLNNYINDHFAFRQELVTANALVQAKLFKVSSEDLIVAGNDGWLYYSNTLLDYQGTRGITKRGYHNIVKLFELMDEYAKSNDCEFLLTVPPNKNTLYYENMPYYYIRMTDENALSEINKRLCETKVNYVDIYELFSKQDEILYHGTDSHWNNKGAALVHDEIMESLGLEYDKYYDRSVPVFDDFEGDLDKILYPLARHTEEDYDYSECFTYYYLTDFSDTSAGHIETANVDKVNSLLMFRDSFGNTLLPFMAQEFWYSMFEKSIPYRMDYIKEYDFNYCILETVERNFTTLQRYAPVMAAPERAYPKGISIKNCEDESGQTFMNSEQFEKYLKLSGKVNAEFVDDESDIYIMLSNDEQLYIFEASPADEYSNVNEGYDYGFVAYIDMDCIPEGSYSAELMLVSGEKGNVISLGQTINR